MILPSLAPGFVGALRYFPFMNNTREARNGRNNDCLTQIATDMLTEVELPDVTPVLCLLYNVAASSSGPPSYVVAPTDQEMWDCMPAPAAAVDFMTQITTYAPIVRPPGSAPAPLSHLYVERRPGMSLDGLAVLFRAWAIDSRTEAGRAVVANLVDGFYQRGDIAASPQRRDVRSVGAVARDGARVTLQRAPGGPVEDPAAMAGLPVDGASIQYGGDLLDGLDRLLSALRTRFPGL